MTFEQLCDKYWEFAQKQFDTSATASCNGLIREAEELKAEFVKDGYGLDKLEEASDVMFYLLYILYKDGWNVHALNVAMQRKLEILKTREWKKNTDGTYSHI